jgi:hypothetical protein
VKTSHLTRRALALATGVLAAIAVVAGPASAASKDRNHDRIPDRWEVRHGLSLDKNQAKRDQDRDDLDNRGEFRAKTDPMDDDSDGDGVEDGDEGAGTIASFDSTTGRLVINAFSGDTISGTVTDDTEIECENDDADQPDEDGEDGPNSGSGNDDDHGDDGPGDDEGDDGGGSGHGRRSQGDDDENCSVADLTTGTVVREAELELSSAGAVFEEIEL